MGRHSTPAGASTGGRVSNVTASLSPIAVFGYRRAHSLARTLDDLQACPEYASSPVYVFSDGPKNDTARRDVEAVREMLARRRTPNMTIIESPENRGLARSIIDGVERLTREYGRVIVIEDDLRLSPLTLAWFNRGLDQYEHEDRVMQISAHVHTVPALRRTEAAFFLPFTTTWGWATWKRAWDRFDPAAEGWEALKTDTALAHRFDVGGAFQYSRMMIAQMEAALDSWGVRFYWTVAKADGLVLFPPVSLVKNHGVDLKATHGVKSLALSALKSLGRSYPRDLPRLPTRVEVDVDALELLRVALRRRSF